MPGAVSAAVSQVRLFGYLRPKLSNSPLWAPPIKASHSSGVKRRTGPRGSRLFRTPTPPSGRSATSTQLPLEKLSELLTQFRLDFSSPFSIMECPTVMSLNVRCYPELSDYIGVTTQRRSKFT